MNPNSPNPLSVKIDANPVFSGLDEFMKGLERLFYAEATAKSWMSENGSEDLVLHICSPIYLLEALHHHRRGHWGAIPSAGTGAGISRFEEMLRALEARNGRPVDIEELSLELKDVLIVIRKNHSHSIAREFDLLLETLAAHFVYLTRGMIEMPYEIHIPVLEDGPVQAEALSAAETNPYYGYWGVYFESGIEARIYDLQNRQLLDAELHFGNLPSR